MVGWTEGWLHGCIDGWMDEIVLQDGQVMLSERPLGSFLGASGGPLKALGSPWGVLGGSLRVQGCPWGALGRSSGTLRRPGSWEGLRGSSGGSLEVLKRSQGRSLAI